MIEFLIGLAITFILLLLFSRIRLWIGVLAAALTFGIINLSFNELIQAFHHTLTTLDNWFLVVAVGLIPVLGGIIRKSVLMDDVLDKLRGSKKLYLMIAPALFGLIPIPGGALLSCPLLKGFDDNISHSKSVAINIWFRHIFVIIYPLSSSLIIASQLAGLTITTAIISMFPFSLIIIVIGYFILLADVKEEKNIRVKKKNNSKDAKNIFYLALMLLSAPILHIILVTTVLSGSERVSFLISMLTAITIAFVVNKLSLRKFFKIFATSKVDQFSLLFLFLLVFINVIRSYEQLDTIFEGFTPPLVLVGFFAFILSFISGRIEVALSIVYPIMFAAYGSETIPPVLFAFIYFSLFAGYLVAPLHPCMAFSLEYFETKYYLVLKKLLPLLLIPLILISLLVFILY